jgi:hypothetical protein
MAIADGAYVRLAAASAKVHFTLPYKRRRSDAAFRAAWEEAMELGTAALEDEAVRRAYHGVEEPVFYQGVQCGSVTRYSDRLLIFLLKARNPAYRDTSKIIINNRSNVNAVFADVERIVAGIAVQEVEQARRVEAVDVVAAEPQSDVMRDIAK